MLRKSYAGIVGAADHNRAHNIVNAHFFALVEPNHRAVHQKSVSGGGDLVLHEKPPRLHLLSGNKKRHNFCNTGNCHLLVGILCIQYLPCFLFRQHHRPCRIFSFLAFLLCLCVLTVNSDLTKQNSENNSCRNGSQNIFLHNFLSLFLYIFNIRIQAVQYNLCISGI